VLRLHQFKVNAHTKSGATMDARQWYAAAGLAIQTDIMSTIAYAPVHSFIPAHVDVRQDQQNATMIWGVAAPGQLSNSIARAFSEVYFMHVIPGEKGAKRRVLQTESGLDGLGRGPFIALSEMQVPNFCEPSWEKVTAGMRNGKGK
jgi:hypothetical protein